MKVASVVGARPQFVKAAVVSRLIRQSHREILIHTGQHYDAGLSDVFFDELEIPSPDINLGCGSASHGVQTGAMLAALEGVLQRERPDWVIVYGDTNSTLAGALAATKLGIKVNHVEAGLRSFNRRMPEEVNRVVTDHVADLLCCPSAVALDNARAEGLGDRALLIADVMADALTFAVERAEMRSDAVARLGLSTGRFILVTVHRAENTDDVRRLRDILGALDAAECPAVFPVHPRTRHAIAVNGVELPRNVMAIDPVGYLDMVRLASSANAIVTDSGGLQKEAYWLGVPCVTVRDETEWVETVANGWNVLVGADPDRIRSALTHVRRPAVRPPLYLEGETIATAISRMERQC